jgi:NAD-dependent deacetylase
VSELADETALEVVARWLRAASTVTVLTGAGISTDSGIPDFRGPQGVWTTNPSAQAMFTLQNYVADADVRRRAWRSRLEHGAWIAEPNAGHFALVALERAGRLHAIVTQNIDGLHQRAGTTTGKVVEIHGTIHDVACLSCEWRGPMLATLDRVRAGEADPPCEVCGGILKSATVSFGQQLRPEVLRRAQEAADTGDVFLAVGTSLTVHPAAGLARRAATRGARLVIINAEPTPYDGLAHAVLRAPIRDVLPQIVPRPDAAVR